MKKLLLLSILTISTLSLSAQQYNWGKRIGAKNYDAARSLAVDAQGNSYTVGYCQDTIDFDPGPGTHIRNATPGKAYTYILKLDKHGNFKWVNLLSCNSDFYIRHVELDHIGNIYITGYFKGTADFDPGSGTYNVSSTNNQHDAFLAKYNSSGTLLWAHKFGSVNSDQGCSIACDGAGYVYLTGMFDGNTVDFDPGPGTHIVPGYSQVFLLKLDSNSNFVNVEVLFGKVSQITLDKSANIYITSWFTDSSDMDPGPGVHRIYGHYSIGSYITTAYLCKLDSSGDFLWAKSMGGNRGGYVCTDDSDNVFCTGELYARGDLNPGTDSFMVTPVGGAQADVFLTKLNADGDFQWATNFGSVQYENLGGIMTKSNGNVVVAGNFMQQIDFDPGTPQFNATSVGNFDVFVTEFSGTGSFVNAWTFGGKNEESAWGLGIDQENSIYVVGSLKDTVDLDPGTGTHLTFAGGPEDLFIVKLGQCTKLLGTSPGAKSGQKGTNVQFTVSSVADAAQYQWQADTAGSFVNITDGTDYSGTNTSTLTVKSVRLAQSGHKYRALISYGSCNDSSGSATLSVTNTSLYEHIDASLRIYPNPAHNYIRIETLTPGTFYLTDINGKRIKEFRVENSEVVNISELPAGVYFISSVQTPGTHYKLIKY